MCFDGISFPKSLHILKKWQIGLDDDDVMIYAD